MDDDSAEHLLTISTPANRQHTLCTMPHPFSHELARVDGGFFKLIFLPCVTPSVETGYCRKFLTSNSLAESLFTFCHWSPSTTTLAPGIG